MAKFKYRMQNILDIKMKLESQAKIAYGIANQKYIDEQKKLQDIVLRRASYERILKESMTGKIDVRQVSHARADVNAMKTLMRRQMMEVHKAERILEDSLSQPPQFNNWGFVAHGKTVHSTYQRKNLR